MRSGSQDRAPFEGEFVLSLRDATKMLGGDVGYFMVRTQEDGKDVHHVLLACDPLWGFEYVTSDSSSKDPWLRYAAGHSAPVRAADISCRSDQERAVVASAAKYGFGDAVLVPAPSPHGRSRFALLVIGSRDSGMRTRFDVSGYRAAARDIGGTGDERQRGASRKPLVDRLRRPGPTSDHAG